MNRRRPPSRVRLVVLGATLAVAVVLGGSGCSGKGTDDALTKQEYIAKAKPLCKATKARIAKRFDALDPQKPAALSNYAVYVGKQMLALVEDLRALGSPANDGGRTNTSLNAYQRSFQAFIDDPGKAGQAAGDKQLQAASKHFAAYGLPDCTVAI